jgi:hypothetical protein
MIRFEMPTRKLWKEEVLILFQEEDDMLVLTASTHQG